MHIQRPKRHRLRLSCAAVAILGRTLRREADRYDCSVSWVIVQRLCESFGIVLDRQDRYDGSEAPPAAQPAPRPNVHAFRRRA